MVREIPGIVAYLREYVADVEGILSAGRKNLFYNKKGTEIKMALYTKR